MGTSRPFPLLAFLGAALTVAACAQSSATDPHFESDAAPPTDGSPDGGEADVFSVSATIHSIAPAQERTVCQVLSLGNEEPVVVRSIRASLSPGSHHMIVYRTAAPTTSSPSPCLNIPGGPDTLLIAQRANTVVEYPEAAGLHLPEGQHIRLEIHYFNYFAENIDVTGLVEFEVVPADGTREPVHVLFTGETTLTIPDRTDGYVEESFHPISASSRVFALTSHTHSRGVYASLHRATDIGDPDAVLLHESHDWAEPPLDFFDPPLTFGSGAGLWLRCVYDNEDAWEVNFGTGFNDEMCFLWAYWY
jgi:hypothetical protein